MTSAESTALRHDQPHTVSDLYSRRSFAEQLGRLLALPAGSPGIVVGIEGPWGSGKTTVIRYLIESLENVSDDGPIVVEFNPWMLAGADALVEALLTELASGIGMNAGTKQAEKSLALASKVLGYAGLMRHLKYLKYVPGVSLVGVAAETVGTALHHAGEFAADIGDAVDNAKKVVEEAEKLVSVKVGLSQRKKDVIAALQELDRPIVVVVDDLDRLTPDEIKAVFRTIKAVADFPRVAYLLAYDRNVIAESLGGGPTAGGNAYIEKIVQVAYPISPAFPWQLQQHLSEEIQALLTRIGRELEVFEADLMGKAMSLTCSMLRYPRDVSRLINRLTLSLGSTTHEVNAADVIVAESLFHRFPAMRDTVVKSPELFTGSYWSLAEELHSTDWSMYFGSTQDKRREAWQVHLPENKAECAIVTTAVKFLFPLVTGGRTESPRSHLRISELSRLIRFLACTSVTGVQEVADIHRLLGLPDGLGEMLSDLDGQRATEMVNHMIAYMDTAKALNNNGVVQEVTRSCAVDKLAQSSSRDYSRAVATLVANCLQRMADKVRDAVLEFVESVPLVFGFDFLSTVGMAHGLVRGAEQHKIAEATRYVAEPGVVEHAIGVWRERVRGAIASGAVIEEQDLFVVLYGLGHLGDGSKDADAIEAFRELCMNTPGGLTHFFDQARPYKGFQPVTFFLYVWGVNAMADLVEASPHAGEFSWYIEQLRTDAQVHDYVAKRNKE
ncbi:P-loop NTPase fold protein [Burkholderia sp. BCC1977]|uniref:KAP family P-loop NTPase fold protein n=1 Tax=Burkholderia sp. BCC1977 TaxID=2817440 RepID=UPI002ABE64B7|nr:P-loop NTPase fold protein [Burkholderia sp. BCC1977]